MGYLGYVRKTGREEMTRARRERKERREREKKGGEKAGPTVLENFNGTRDECDSGGDSCVQIPSSGWEFKPVCCY